LKLYGIDNDDYDFVDLILDTTDKEPEQVAEEIIAHARERALLGPAVGE
jgi:cytidylate kinase